MSRPGHGRTKLYSNCEKKSSLDFFEAKKFYMVTLDMYHNPWILGPMKNLPVLVVGRLQKWPIFLLGY